MNGLIRKTRLLAIALGICATSALAQQSLEWMKETPPGSAPGMINVAPGIGDTTPAVRADPKYRAKIHTELAAAYYQAGAMKVALDEVRLALEADPDFVQAYSLRGLIYGNLKENAKADEDFRKALGEAFIEIAQTDEGKEIISVFSQVGYTWGKDSDYDGERDAQAMLKSAGK